MLNIKKQFLAGFALLFLAGVLLVVLVDVPQFLDKNTSGALRTFALRAGGITIRLKDRILARTITDKLVRLQTSGACQFCDLTNADLREIDIHDADLRRTDLSGVDLSGTNLTGANLTGANLTRANLTGANLTGANLTGANLTGANLTGALMDGTDLKGADLIGADLSGTNLADANLTRADLQGANLTGTLLRSANLRGANLSGVSLSTADLARTNLYAADLVELELREIGGNLGESFLEIKDVGNYKEITSFDLSGDTHYLTTRSGILYELKNDKSTIVLDFNNNPKFISRPEENGLMSVVSNDNFVYISYTTKGDDTYGSYLVVDEYSKTFSKIRNIVSIGIPMEGGHHGHHAGTLVFDKLGKLYLSVGDGNDPQNHSQNLQSLLGKILRIDVSQTNLKPEIVAYGLRVPWKISIDSKNRMFVGDVGDQTIESVYLLDDLYPTTPYNLGWPVFEGTKRRTDDPLTFQDTLAPIHEYRHDEGVGFSVIGGFFLDDPEVYLFGDLIGIVRLLQKQEDGNWYEIYSQHMATDIWSFGYDEETKKIFISGSSKTFELSIPSQQIKSLPQATLCRTTMLNGTINNSGC